VITGRPARGIVNRVIHDVGPINSLAPEFPRAYEALAPLRIHAEKHGLGDYSPLWAGQAASMCRDIPAGALTKLLFEEATSLMKVLAAGL
jgi:nitronate monooxygenase